MRKVVIIGAAALAASTVAASPAVSQTPVAAARDNSAAHQAAANDLAEALSPDGTVEEQVDAMIKQLFDQLFGSNPDFIELEKEYPGLRAAITERARPVLIKSALRILPLYRADLAKLYGDNLTTQEMREAAAFMRSPEMQAFTGSLRRNIKFKQTTASALDERDVTPTDLKSDIRGSMGDVLADLTPQQKAKLSAFFTSPLGRKLTALNPQKLALNTKWFNYSTPESEKELEVAMAAGMIDHVAKTDPEMAAIMRKSLKPDGTLPD
jgi:hypothetical protein